MTVIEHSDLAPEAAPAVVGPRRLLSRLRTPQAITGAAMLAVVVLAGLLAPLLAPHGPAEVHFDAPFQLPGTVGFALGTDDLGRDVLSRMMYGIRASLMVGIVAAQVVGAQREADGAGQLERGVEVHLGGPVRGQQRREQPGQDHDGEHHAAGDRLAGAQPGQQPAGAHCDGRRLRVEVTVLDDGHERPPTRIRG